MLARAISFVFLWNIFVGSLELEPRNATLINHIKKRATLSDCSLAIGLLRSLLVKKPRNRQKLG